MHYHRFVRNGDPTVTKKVFRLSERCSVDGCNGKPWAKGLCTNHYALNRRNGEPIRVRVFTDSYIKDGYKYVRVGHRHYEPEHRIVMERFIGRKLKTTECVHHIDEDTLNNSPSNLQIVSHSEHQKIHVKRKLTERDVKEIRKQAKSGVDPTTLAQRYSVTRGAIHAIISFRTWKDV